MTKTHRLPTLIAAIIGVSGVLLLLFAWHLPPFSPSEPTTENAYIRGKVTSIAPQLSGYLREVDAVDFQTVRKGDTIARIDDRIFHQKLTQAKAKRAEAQAELQVARRTVRSSQAQARSSQASVEAAQSALEKARTDRDRAVKLRKRGVSSQSATDTAELALRQAQASLKQARAALEVSNENINAAKVQLSARQADVASAEAAVELAEIDLENTVIRAPADGRLGQVSAHVGQYVTPGTALVSHVGTDIWVIANFKETVLKGMQANQKVRFTVDALGGRAFTGRVQSASPAAASEFSLLSGSNATGNFTKIAQRLPVRISIDPGQEMSNYLTPGFSVVVSVDTQDTAAM